MASCRGSTSSGVAREHRRRRHRRQPHPAAAAPPRTSSSLAAASSAAGGTGVTSSAGAASAMRTARVLAKDEWSWDRHHLQALFTNNLQTIYKSCANLQCFFIPKTYAVGYLPRSSFGAAEDEYTDLQDCHQLPMRACSPASAHAREHSCFFRLLKLGLLQEQQAGAPRELTAPWL